MYVMIDALSGHNDVHHVERCVCTASTSTRYDEVRVVVVDHLHSADGRVNLADATLLQNNLLVADLAKNEVLEVPRSVTGLSRIDLSCVNSLSIATMIPIFIPQRYEKVGSKL